MGFKLDIDEDKIIHKLSVGDINAALQDNKINVTNEIKEKLEKAINDGRFKLSTSEAIEDWIDSILGED